MSKSALCMAVSVAAAEAFTTPAGSLHGLSLRKASATSARPLATTPKMSLDSAILLAADPDAAQSIINSIVLPGLVAFSVTSATKGGSIAAPAAAPAQSGAATQDMTALAQTNFKRWNDALQTKDAKTVANLYTSGDLSFLPTVSPKHITDTKDTEQYFVNFVLKNPFGTITDESVQVFGNGDSYLHSGMYTFELGDAGARTPVEARFSYLWQKSGGEWKISHHHSSVRPKNAPPAEEMNELARYNFKRWNDALQTKNPVTVANLYNDGDLSFLPTVSPEHIKNTGSTEDYFVAFVQKNPFGTITDDSVQVFNAGDAYLHSGMYTFELGDAGARTPVEARFSYLWQKSGGEWKISHHHSSVRPEPAPVAA